jgi:hypothetical protein
MTRLLAAVIVLASISACGANGGSPAGEICVSPQTSGAGPNVVAVVVDQGPQNIGYTNGLFATVTLCEPAPSTNCQPIDHLLVDTGSVGVRVLESELTLALPVAQNASGLALAECLQFVDGSAWGSVKIADFQIGGEAAKSLRIQVIGEQAFPMASECSATGSAITDFKTLGANGILGVGIQLNDCGTACAPPAATANQYFACSSAQPGGCNVVSVPQGEQVANPVAAFPIDNNGVIIQLPCIPASGAPSVPGQLVFGIETQANNGLGAAKVLPINVGGFGTTAFPGQSTNQVASYLDSGSNGLFFLDSATTRLPPCGGGLKDFYCPGSTAYLSATVWGSDGTNADVNFSVANASRLTASAYAFSNLAGPMPGYPSDYRVPGFDWGLPFFFGRNVYTAVEGRSTPSGVVGPYFAF